MTYRVWEDWDRGEADAADFQELDADTPRDAAEAWCNIFGDATSNEDMACLLVEDVATGERWAVTAHAKVKTSWDIVEVTERAKGNEGGDS